VNGTGGLHSYRFTEALSFGCIPVILSDDWVIPFAELADPRAYTVMVPERRWSDIPGILRNMSTPVVTRMHAAVVEVYEQVFRNPLQTAMQITVSRLPAANKVPPKSKK
jgi:Exostosin family